jgi:hypothetical protein
MNYLGDRTIQIRGTSMGGYGGLATTFRDRLDIAEHAGRRRITDC